MALASQPASLNLAGTRIAIVGMACVFPDACTPMELWENVLAQRRAFRQLPAERLRAEDYQSSDPRAPDRSYVTEGAVIEGYEFDRVAFRVVGSTFRSADLAHWLALDVAARALADAGFPEGRGLPRDAAGVLLGNTLTGEFTRACLLRLRWPYVRRVLDAALRREGWQDDTRRGFLERLEAEYKLPFPEVGEESLAGGLSNTIAGRICNQFDFKGGGYTVDGACASSLLAVANACAALSNGDLDVALAGGVDLSLDPFEIVGFAKTGALAADEMRVFDRRSAGFWPGEGCGFIVLMREQDALEQGCRIYATIRGWGISSDGQGGITRPEADGQLEALRRAYRRAGFGADTVEYCEGHGTGTAVGDATELEVLSRARREANPQSPPAVVGSIKANIGHTKAAAGIAGLIKATMAVHTQVLPPTTGCEQPHALLSGPSPAIGVLGRAEPWPLGRPLRASVSGMGFGGINAHVVLESNTVTRRRALSAREQALSRTQQDAEVFLVGADSCTSLAQQVDKVQALAARLSRSELTDLAVHLQKRLASVTANMRCRAAVVASRPTELARRAQTLRSWLEEETRPCFRSVAGVYLGAGGEEPSIAFLFPGQGAPMHPDGGIWRRRFSAVEEIYARAALPKQTDSVSTRLMQPAIVTASLAGLAVLDELGLRAGSGIGQSLGELTALHWAGAYDAEALLRIARVRGAAMADLGDPTGAMLALALPWQKVQAMIKGDGLAIVGYNSPRQTAVAGEADAIRRLAARARALGCQATVIPVSHAFHTPLVAAAVPALAGQLDREEFRPLQRAVFSTVTGKGLEADADLRELLCRQVTSPVRLESGLGALLGLEVGTDFYKKAPARPQSGVDLLIEVGPGEILAGLARDTAEVPVIALDAGGPSLCGLLQAFGAAFALGASVRHEALFAGRFARPFDLNWQPKFFANPCEQAPVLAESSEPSVLQERVRELARPGALPAGPQAAGTVEEASSPTEELSPLKLVRQLVAKRVELPVASVQLGHRMLNDLHLNSITVGQIVSEAARRLSLPRVLGLTEFANASTEEIAGALEELKREGEGRRVADTGRQPPGVDLWIESFAIELVAANRPNRGGARPTPQEQPAHPGAWRVLASPEHPLAGPLRERFRSVKGKGVVLCLPPRPNEDHIALLLEAARVVSAIRHEPRFVVVQHGGGGGGFARTLHLETPGLTTCVVSVPASSSEAGATAAGQGGASCPESVEWILSEVESASGFTEAHYDAEGRRFEPRLKWQPLDSSPELKGWSSCSSSPSVERGNSPRTRTRTNDEGDFPIGPGDVLLVTGGGKGIAAECALALGSATGVRLVLMGRSAPEPDRGLKENLGRFEAAGVRCVYVQADVADAMAVRTGVATAERELGPVTALLHAAGTNTPQLISALDETAFRRTVEPKLQGARNLLAALEPERLQLFLTFGSIIARAGFRGEADYAAANEWMTTFTEDFAAAHPRCRCHALEWSVWSGVGMGERLGRLESLIQQGILPIPVDEGVRILLETLRRPTSPVAQVITSRFGEPLTVRLHEPELPLRRFLERKRVGYPGVELIVDVELSATTDPYLNDHAVRKQRLFPAVLGLEAMAQSAMALIGTDTPPDFEKVDLMRPIGVPAEGVTKTRLAALRRAPDTVEVCLRSEETEYHVDHFRALCRFGGRQERQKTGALQNLAAGQATQEDASALPLSDLRGTKRLCLDPGNDLYGRILFHEGRFRRVEGYQLLDAHECLAEVGPDEGVTWFGPYLPGELVLGDPGARDATLHAIQACVPHRRILPTGIGRLRIHRLASGPRFVHARQRSREGDNFVYDLQVSDADGNALETWEQLRLRAVEVLPAPASWPEPLVAPYLERRMEELLAGASLHVVFQADAAGGRRESSDTVLREMLGSKTMVHRRPDGKPVVTGGGSVSVAHAEGLTLAVAGESEVACDLEPAVVRSEMAWRDLLGEERFKLAERLSRENNETLSTAGARLWTVGECLKKAGISAAAPLVLVAATSDGWVAFRSGALMVASGAIKVREIAFLVALAARSVATESCEATSSRAVA